LKFGPEIPVPDFCYMIIFYSVRLRSDHTCGIAIVLNNEMLQRCSLARAS
jgi:hypothetical protein